MNRLSGRRFVQDLTFATCAGTLWRTSRVLAQSVPAQPTLSGDSLELVIGATPFNVTGRARIATAVNGCVPAPILRLRQGDAVTIHVTNRLTEPTSIHWHCRRRPTGPRSSSPVSACDCASSTAAFRWDGEAWVGTDTNRLWLKSEGLTVGGRVEDGDHELLYARPISTYFDLQAGVRYDLDSAASRGWAAVGLEGLAPYFFHLSATLYASDAGH